MPRAAARWALDSGGFSEIAEHGRWTLEPRTYAAEVRRYQDEIGRLDWAAVQDWMCEPVMLCKTGLSVKEHQRRTCDSYDHLREIAPDLPWTPVLQGWALDDYLQHLELYADRGHDLRALSVVGVGSVCRRQATKEAGAIVRRLAAEGLRLHGFGFKVGAFQQVEAHRYLASSDSLAWSFAARREPPLPGHEHKNCANCLDYALSYRSRVLALTDRRSGQLELFSQEDQHDHA